MSNSKLSNFNEDSTSFLHLIILWSYVKCLVQSNWPKPISKKKCKLYCARKMQSNSGLAQHLSPVSQPIGSCWTGKLHKIKSLCIAKCILAFHCIMGSKSRSQRNELIMRPWRSNKLSGFQYPFLWSRVSTIYCMWFL